VILRLIEALRKRDSIGSRPRIFRWRDWRNTSGWHDKAILVAADECLAGKSVSDAAWDWFKRAGLEPRDGIWHYYKELAQQARFAGCRPEPLSSKARILGILRWLRSRRDAAVEMSESDAAALLAAGWTRVDERDVPKW